MGPSESHSVDGEGLFGLSARRAIACSRLRTLDVRSRRLRFWTWVAMGLCGLLGWCSVGAVLAVGVFGPEQAAEIIGADKAHFILAYLAEAESFAAVLWPTPEWLPASGKAAFSVFARSCAFIAAVAAPAMILSALVSAAISWAWSRFAPLDREAERLRQFLDDSFAAGHAVELSEQIFEQNPSSATGSGPLRL